MCQKNIDQEARESLGGMVEKDNDAQKMDHTECEASPDTVSPENDRVTDSACPIPVQIDPELLENESDGKPKHTELTKAQLKFGDKKKRPHNKKSKKFPPLNVFEKPEFQTVRALFYQYAVN